MVKWLTLFVAFASSCFAQGPLARAALQLADYSNFREKIWSINLHRPSTGYLIIDFSVDTKGKVSACKVNSTFFGSEVREVKKYADSVDYALFSSFVFLPTGEAYDVKFKIYIVPDQAQFPEQEDPQLSTVWRLEQMYKQEMEKFFRDERGVDKDFVKADSGLVLAPIYINVRCRKRSP